MTALSDRDITAAMACPDGHPLAIRIQPLENWRKQLQPASVDLRLGTKFLRFNGMKQTVDLANREAAMVTATHKDSYHLYPGGFVLATTIERVTLGSGVVGKVEGKSSLGRLGLTVHVTAGFVDPGFDGTITLEMHNVSPNPIILRPGLAICQIAFFEMKTPCERPYGSPGLGSRYQGQDTVQMAKP